MTDSLRQEGFNNLVEKDQVDSINELVDSYDLLILDLTDVAKSVSDHDGLGVIEALKKRQPTLPILVVSGKSLLPEYSAKLSMAKVSDHVYICPHCGEEIPTVQIFGVHCSPKDDTFKPGVQWLTECGTCLACLKCIHIRAKLFGRL